MPRLAVCCLLLVCHAVQVCGQKNAAGDNPDSISLREALRSAAELFESESVAGSGSERMLPLDVVAKRLNRLGQLGSSSSTVN